MEAVITEIATYFGVKGEHIIAPLFVLISALIGGTIALWAISSNRATARQKNSMDFVNGHYVNDEILLALKAIRELCDEADDSTASVCRLAKDSEQESENASHIRKVLNYYESMAICVHHGIYDDRILKDTMYTTVVDIFKKCKPFIDRRREIKKTNTFFQEFEILYERWKKEPLKKKKKQWWRPFGDPS